ncbi:MAG: signal peptidase I [Candidatus Moraniibacteriota bacterium]
MLKRLGTILQGVMAGVVIVFVLVMASSFLPLPNMLKLFVVRSGSMEPTLHTGSLILVRAASDYGVGDIVTVATSDKQSVTHRIVDKRVTEAGLRYQTKGDANEESDPTTVTPREIVGKTYFAIPYLGYPVAYAQTKSGFIWLIVLPAVLIILSEAWSIVQEVRRLARKKSVEHSEVNVEEKVMTRRLTFSDPRTNARPQPSRPVFTPPPVPVRRRKIV